MAKKALVSILPKTRRFPGGISLKYHDFSGPLPFYDRASIPRSLSSALGHDGLDSNVVMACVFWIMRTFTEAVAIVESWSGQPKVWKYVEDHKVELLIDRPNPFYDADAMWKAIAASYTLDGNAYLRKVRNAFGDVIQLWYVPHWSMSPEAPTDGSQFIDYYSYSPDRGQAPIQLAPRDVIHFRFGLDPRDPRLGLAPFKTLLREVDADDAAQVFTETILNNMGTPSMMVSPADATFRPNPDQVKELRDTINEASLGSRRGSTMVFGVPMKVEQFGFDANKIMLSALRDISEERVCAVFGLPAAVVGFGSGQQATHVGASMREMRKLAWVQCLIPMLKTFAAALTKQLLPDFQSQNRFRVRFDTSEVSAFLEERLLEAQIARELVNGGMLRADRGQEMSGIEVDDTMKVYFIPTNCVLAGPDAAKIRTFPTAQPKEPDPPEGDRGGENDEGNLPNPVAARAGLTGSNGNGNGSEP